MSMFVCHCAIIYATFQFATTLSSSLTESSGGGSGTEIFSQRIEKQDRRLRILSRKVFFTAQPRQSAMGERKRVVQLQTHYTYFEGWCSSFSTRSRSARTVKLGHGLFYRRSFCWRTAFKIQTFNWLDVLEILV